jgi:hypothetical protein
MPEIFVGRKYEGESSGNTAEYFYNTVTTVVSFTEYAGGAGSEFPSIGTVIYSECDGADLNEWIYNGGDSQATIDINTNVDTDSPQCCTINPSDFTFGIDGDSGSTDGVINITSGVVAVDDYEASIDGGAFVQGSLGLIQFSTLTPGTKEIVIKAITGVCFATVTVYVPDVSESFPFVLDITEPSQFMPVFYPISFVAAFADNIILVTQNGVNTVVETSDTNVYSYLQANPRIRLYGSSYVGTYLLTVLNSTQFIIDVAYSGDESSFFVPMDNQVFFLFCEREFNTFIKIAEIASAADVNGNFNIRVEGFLQSEFELNPPVDGDEITLGRKYYLQARDYESTSVIRTAVYSAIESLTPYLESLVPLGPAPLNFINQSTGKGIPVLFSWLNTTSGRVVNVISSKHTDIISTNDIVLGALPCNQYAIEWIKAAGNLNGSVVSDPALPSWISMTTGTNRINLEIDTCSGDGGDYEADDFLSDDYLTAGFNGLTGCYGFELSDDDGLLFTLSICIYQIQQEASNVCPDNAFNIAWINRQGGWNSYVFASDSKDKSKKALGFNVGDSTNYKRDTELKKSSVQDVYETVTVLFSLKNQRELLFIAGLRKSIQAYLFNDSTQAWDIPIYIDVESFPTYSLPFNQASDGNGSFTFRYSNELRVQRQ